MARILHITSDQLFALHTKQVLANMQASYEAWTVYSVEQLVFDTLLYRAG